MRKLLFLLLCVGASGPTAFAQAGNSYVAPDGVNRLPGTVLHCVGPGNVAVPCGTATQPVYVTSGSGLATANAQLNQLASEQAISVAAGTQQDATYTGGSGSIIAILKALFSTSTNGVPATPYAGTPVSRSTTVSASTSYTLFPANPTRHYLAVQAPVGTAIWLNFVGGPAAPNGTDCIQLGAGTFYESGQFVTKGLVTIYAPMVVSIAAWEG